MGRGLTLLATASRHLPRCLEAPIVGAAARGLYWFGSRKREAALRNHEVVLSSARTACRGAGTPPASVRRAFRVQIANYLEMLRAPSLDPASLRSRLRMRGIETLEEALGEGRGCILVGPHMGDWELSGMGLADRGYDLTVVTGIQMRRTWSARIRRDKEQRGIRVVTPDDSYRDLFRALRGGGLVALLLDGDVYRTGVTVPFFGRPARFPAGPSRLARKTGSPLLLAYSIRHDDGTVDFRVHRRLDPLPVATAAATARIASALEEVVAPHLDQWCTVRKLWGSGEP